MRTENLTFRALDNNDTFKLIMKYLLLLFSILPGAIMSQEQNERPLKKTVITSNMESPKVRTNEDGELNVNVSPKSVAKFKAKGFVRYSDFGAIGDGKTDDIDAIAATHAFANQHGLKVKADEEATYYIGGKEQTAVILTDTDFGTATFIIDDTEVQNRTAPIFMVKSGLSPFKLDGISSLIRKQKKIDVSLSGYCLIKATNSQIKHYIRFGLNQNNGSPQTVSFWLIKTGILIWMLQ